MARFPRCLQRTGKGAGNVREKRRRYRAAGSGVGRFGAVRFPALRARSGAAGMVFVACRYRAAVSGRKGLSGRRRLPFGTGFAGDVRSIVFTVSPRLRFQRRSGLARAGLSGRGTAGFSAFSRKKRLP